MSSLPKGSEKIFPRLVQRLPASSQSGHTTKDAMTESPSRYGGIAAVFVFGIGLLALGRIWTGIGVLVFGALAMAIVLSPSASSKALFAAVGALILSGVLAYKAAYNEVSGTATYHRGFGRQGRSEQVTREAAPDKFREATNFLWAGSILSVLGAVIGFRFSRKLDDCSTDF